VRARDEKAGALASKGFKVAFKESLRRRSSPRRRTALKILDRAMVEVVDGQEV
jgi:hypothetical protein